MNHKSYHELSQLETLKERFEYLKLPGEVGGRTFGSYREFNQMFYSSQQWRRVRNEAIIRDSSCDLGVLDYELYDRVVVHHINPITIDDIRDENWDKLLSLENLITTSYNTHNAIHFGNSSGLPNLPMERKPNDTCPWR